MWTVVLGANVESKPIVGVSSPVVLERGRNHRVEEFVTTTIDDQGLPLQITNRYTVLAPGLHYLENGEWRETVAAFAVTPEGWVARRGSHQVALAHDIFTAGAVRVTSPEGILLRSTPLQIFLYDRQADLSVVLGELQSAHGELVEPNVILYRNAFTTFPADVRVVYRADGVECDVVLRGRLPRPELLGLDPATTELRVLTELFETPPTFNQEPDTATELREPLAAKADTQLGWGSLIMERGTAYQEEVQAAGTRRPAAPVRKRHWQAEGRAFLEESSSFEDLEPLLEGLPEAGYSPELMERTRTMAGIRALPSLVTRHAEWVAHTESSSRLGPLAAATSPGVVVDWTTLLSIPDQTFKGDTTYVVESAINLTGNVTFEGGTVVKFSPGGGGQLTIPSAANLIWRGAPYRPIILTGRDDDSVGERVLGSTGNFTGIYAGTALSLSGSGRTNALTLSNLAIRRAQVGVSAVYFATTGPLKISHVQFVNCEAAITFQLGSPSTETYTIENALCVGGTSVFKNLYYAKVFGRLLTVDGATQLSQNIYTPSNSTLRLERSLLANLTQTPVMNVDFLVNIADVALMHVAPAFTFDSAAQGAHYIPLTSTLRLTGAANAGILGIGGEQDLTITKPSILTGNLAAVSVLTRTNDVSYSESGVPGYRYWKIDFVAANANITTSLTLTNGVAVGLAGDSGFNLGVGAQFSSCGLPTVLNRLVHCALVQEQPIRFATSGSGFSMLSVTSSNASAKCRFTEFESPSASAFARSLPTLVGAPLTTFTLRDCQLYNINVFPCAGTIDASQVTVVNNLFVRCNVTCSRYTNTLGASQVSVTLRNNLHRFGGVNLVDVTSSFPAPLWSLKDSLFDSATLAASGPSATTNQICFNGFAGSSPQPPTTLSAAANFVSLNSDNGYVAGPFGDFYYPTNSQPPSLGCLRNVGSQSVASAGLYHFTTRADGLREGADEPMLLDVGFHYPAGANADADEDGLPDWLEDTNGNGVWDSVSETDWTRYDTDEDLVSDGEELRFGSNPLNVDSDSDGRSDKLEYTEGTDPTSPSTAPALLREWNFGNAVTGFMSDSDPNPDVTPSIISAISPVGTPANDTIVFDGHAARLDSGILRYPVSGNFNLLHGSLRFVYIPTWYLGGAADTPTQGQECRLFQCGANWHLSVSGDGRYLVFRVPRSGGGNKTAFVASLPRDDGQNLTHRRAYEIHLAWSRTAAFMKINGMVVPNERVVTLGMSDGGPETLPSASELAFGLVFGSNTTGGLRAQGWLDQVQSFNAIPFGPWSLVDNNPVWGRVLDSERRRSQVSYAVALSDGLSLNWFRGWEGDPSKVPDNYKVERRELTSAVWESLGNIMDHQIKDPVVLSPAPGLHEGNYYEYRINRAGKSPTTTLGAWHGSAMESRGTVILIVDQTIATDLSNEINAFKRDLVGDGWQVVSSSQPRHVNFQPYGAPAANYISDRNQIKTYIRSQWQLNHQTGPIVVILLGHVTVPYSGLVAEDGHPQHLGAWPADIWYGDMDPDTYWTDTGTQIGGDPFCANQPGDGKFDQNYLPGNGKLEMSVGRIDFDSMSRFKDKPSANNASTPAGIERELIRNYLTKDAAFRRGELGTFVSGSMTFMQDYNFFELIESSTSLSGWLSQGPPKISDFGPDLFGLGTTYLWGLHGGYGNFDKVQGYPVPRAIDDLALRLYAPASAFVILRGSYFADWNFGTMQDSFLRACLTPQYSGLAVMWAGRANGGGAATGPWVTRRMGIGGSLGDVLLDTVNGPVQQSARTAFILGDPTLRGLGIKPPKNPRYIVSPGGTITLNWDTSDTGGVSYNVYRATDPIANSWSRRNSSPISGTTFNETVSVAQTYYYMLRALGMSASGEGSYMNLSQGIQIQVQVP